MCRSAKPLIASQSAMQAGLWLWLWPARGPHRPPCRHRRRCGRSTPAAVADVVVRAGESRARLLRRCPRRSLKHTLPTVTAGSAVQSNEVHLTRPRSANSTQRRAASDKRYSLAFTYTALPKRAPVARNAVLLKN